MILPAVFAGVEELNHVSRIRINAHQIRSLVCIAPVAGRRETSRVVRAAMLLRNDVFHVECDERRCHPGNAAVFTRIPSPLAK